MLFRSEYSLGATMTYGMAVHPGSSGLPPALPPATPSNPPLIPCSMFDLDNGRPTWRLETIASGGDVPTYHTYWAPISLQQIAIWPALNTGGTGELVADGVANTPVLVEDADTVDLGDETQDILVDYALHCIAFKLGGAERSKSVV